MFSQQPSPSPKRQKLMVDSVQKKDRCLFAHYGFLLTEWYCANGIPMQAIYAMKSRLIGPQAISGPLVQQRREHKMAANPQKFRCLPPGQTAPKDRQMETWFPHAMMTQLLLESNVRQMPTRSYTVLVAFPAVVRS
jgi:hypothetical protein